MIYQNYHCHKDYTNPRISDSAARIRDYAERAAALGHGILSSVEHGWQGITTNAGRRQKNMI